LNPYVIQEVVLYILETINYINYMFLRFPIATVRVDIDSITITNLGTQEYRLEHPPCHLRMKSSSTASLKRKVKLAPSPSPHHRQ